MNRGLHCFAFLEQGNVLCTSGKDFGRAGRNHSQRGPKPTKLWIHTINELGLTATHCFLMFPRGVWGTSYFNCVMGSLPLLEEELFILQAVVLTFAGWTSATDTALNSPQQEHNNKRNHNIKKSATTHRFLSSISWQKVATKTLTALVLWQNKFHCAADLARLSSSQHAPQRATKLLCPLKTGLLTLV